MGRLNARLAWWGVLVGLLAAINYIGDFVGKPDPNVLYKYSTAADTIVQYLLMFVAVFAIAGWRFRYLALRRPTSWPVALGLVAILFVGSFIVISILDHFLHGGREQGLTPKTWEPAHAGAYIVNAVLISTLDPFVEESTFRGAGYWLLERFGKWQAIVIVGLTFAAAHGLIQAYPELFIFGVVLAWLRWKTNSIYPTMLLHGLFNGVQLVLAVTAH